MKQAFYNLIIACCFLLFIACSSSSDNTAGDISYQQTISETEAFIANEMTSKDIVGLSIALIDAEREFNPEVVWQQGFGFADKETGDKATENTVYCIGSTSKTITAVALLKQMDEGNIALDRPVSDYIPGFSLQIRYPDIDQNDQITPRTLLNMHAGVPGDLYNGVFVLSPPWYEKYMNGLLTYLQQDYPVHKPKTLASYSNTGFTLAGHAAFLAGANGEDASFQQFTQRTVLDPLNMTSSYYEVIDRNIPHLATPYVQGVPDVIWNSNGTATGGFYSSVIDMGKLITMLLSDGMQENGYQFLRADTVREMGRMERTSLDTSSFYQPGLGLDSVCLPAFYGVAPNQDAYGRAWGKNGSTGPYNAMIMMLPDTGLKLGVVVLSNSDTASGAVFSVARTCLLAAVREKLGLSDNPEPKPLPDYSLTAITDENEIAGHYGANASTGYFKIEQRDTGLFWVTNPYEDSESGMALTRKADDSYLFAVDGYDWNVVFIDREDIYGGRYRLMVRMGGDHEIAGPNNVTTLGQQIKAPETVSAAWRARVGKMYLADTMIAMSEFPFLKFDAKDDLLLALTAPTRDVIDPRNDDLAYAGNVLSRGDGALTVTHESDTERIFYLASGYFPIEQTMNYSLGEDDQFEIVLRNETPLSVWRKISVMQGDSFDGKQVHFSVVPGNENDVYAIYNENIDLLDYALGKNAIFQLSAGTYYLAFNPDIDSSGQKVLTSRIVD